MISLTGTTMLVLCGVLAVGLPVLALAGWSRVHGPRPARVAQRVGLLAGCQLAAVLLVAVALNDFGEFYGSWTSLFGSSSGAVQLSAAHIAGTRAATTPTGSLHPSTATAFATPAQEATRGRLESVTVHGENSALSAPAWVYLPPQYFQRQFDATRFPAVEVLSTPAEFGSAAAGGYPPGLLPLVRAHRADPTALVFVESSPALLAAQCTDVPAGPQAQTFYAVDVPSSLAGTYRLDSTGWGAIGRGAEGYCAAKLALTYPQTFSAAVTIDGAARPQPDGTDLFGGSPVLRAENDLSWRLQHLPAPPVAVLAVGTAGRQPGAIAGLARPPMTIERYAAPRRENSTAVLGGGLRWLANRLAAAPDAATIPS